MSLTWTWVGSAPPPDHLGFLVHTSLGGIYSANYAGSDTSGLSGHTTVSDDLDDKVSGPDDASSSFWYQGVEKDHLKSASVSNGAAQVTVHGEVDASSGNSIAADHPYSIADISGSLLATAREDPRVTTIHSSVEQSFYKLGTDKIPWTPAEYDDTKGGDAAATWDVIDNQWAGHENYNVSATGFTNPTYSWAPGGTVLYPPTLVLDQSSTSFLFGFGTGTSGSLSTTTTTCNITDSDEATATKTYIIQWHLPEEANGGPYDIEAGKYNIGGPRCGPVDPGATQLVSDTPAHEEQWSAKLDGAEVIAGAFGQEDLIGAIKVVEAIATLSEWQTDVPDEPESYSGGTNGPTTWSVAQNQNNEIYTGGNVPANLASNPNGWMLCRMYLFQVAHYMDKSWHAFGYDAHGYDGNPNHVIYARKIDAVYDEWQFTQYINPDGTPYTGS